MLSRMSWWRLPLTVVGRMCVSTCTFWGVGGTQVCQIHPMRDRLADSRPLAMIKQPFLTLNVTLQLHHHTQKP